MSIVPVTFVRYVRRFAPPKMPSVFIDQDTTRILLASNNFPEKMNVSQVFYIYPFCCRPWCSSRLLIGETIGRDMDMYWMWIQFQNQNQREDACWKQALGISRIHLPHMPIILSKPQVAQESHDPKTQPNPLPMLISCNILSSNKPLLPRLGLCGPLKDGQILWRPWEWDNLAMQRLWLWVQV